MVSDDATDTIFSRVLQPKRNIGDRGWHNFIVPLEKYSGKTVCLTLRTSGFGDDLSFGWSAWGWGKIICTCPPKKEQEIEKIDSIHQKISDRVNYGNKRAELIKIELLDQNGNPKNIFRSGEFSIIYASIVFNDDIDSDFVVGYKLFSNFGIIYGTCTLWEDITFKKHQKGDVVKIKFTQKLCLAPGFYSIDFDIATAVFPANNIEILNTISNVLMFQIESPKPYCGVIDLYSKIQLE
jgi:hypothetical protein